jgi:hypothetical protein
MSGFLSALVASYATESVTTDEGQTLVKLPKSPKGERGGRLATASKSAINGAPAAPQGFLEGGAKAPVVAPKAAPVKVEPLDPQAFLLMIRDADKARKGVYGRMIAPTPDQVKEVRIEALRRFAGYDPGGVLATQIDNASRTARAALKLGGKGYASQTEKRNALASVAGYVAGAVDDAAARRENLLARRRRAESAIVDLTVVVQGLRRGIPADPKRIAAIIAATPELGERVKAFASDANSVAEALHVEKARLAQIIADLG